MERVFWGDTVRQIEQAYINSSNKDLISLMEQAGKAVADEVLKTGDIIGKNIYVLAGGGNNGGDGYVTARYLSLMGADVKVFYLQEPKTHSSKYMRDICGVEVKKYFDGCLDGAYILIDAVFGIGFHGEIPKVFLSSFEEFNNSSAFKVAIDLPSGVYSDSAVPAKGALNCDLTVTFIGYKLCHMLFPAANYCSRVVLNTIGIPENIMGSTPFIGEVIQSPSFAKRERNTHKGSYGTAALICGSYGMAGAAVLALKSALRSGVGIAQSITHQSIYPIITCAVPEAVCLAYNNDTDIEKIGEAINKASATLIGCGLGVSEFSEKLLHTALKNCINTLIIDADGLNILSSNIELIKQTEANVIITPHPGEMSRLCGVSVEQIENDRITFACSFAKQYGCTVILKGAITVVAHKDGNVFFNTTGNAGMATGGSGDSLGGILVSLCAQGYSSLSAAKTAVYIHGAAADEAKKALGEISLLPSDYIEYLPRLFKKFEE